MIITFLKFCLVGLLGLIIDFAITWVLKEKLNANKLLANGIGFSFAATSNYFLNRFYTFHSLNEMGVEYSWFIITALAGLSLNTLIVYVLSTRLGLNFYLSKVFAIGAVVVWNFGINSLFVFN